MNAYVYQAAMWCEDCAAEIRNTLAMGKSELDIEKEDSEHWPQGPYSNGGGEADCPQHCDDCGKFLENPLTDDGYKYVAEAIDSWPDAGSQEFLRQWAEFYRGENNDLDAAIDRSMLFDKPMRCDQCEMVSINGVPCHEHGCPNRSSRYDRETGEWIKQRECRECGSTVDIDDPCCSEESE